VLPPDPLPAFAAGLRNGALPPGVTARAPDEAARRFDVYRNNVAVSLSRALAARYPVIERLVGGAFFAPLARAFAETHRPRTPVLADWGADFPAFLAGQQPLAPYPYLPDVARIEWARGIAYHSADLPPADLAQIAGADPAGLRLHLHPGLSLVTSAHAAVTIWTANQPGADPATARGATGPEAALILRDRALIVQVWPLTPGGAAFVAALSRDTLLAAAEAAQTIEPGFDPGTLLLRLAQAGALI
jgi:hypothetical protein